MHNLLWIPGRSAQNMLVRYSTYYIQLLVGAGEVPSTDTQRHVSPAIFLKILTGIPVWCLLKILLENKSCANKLARIIFICFLLSYSLWDYFGLSDSVYLGTIEEDFFLLLLTFGNLMSLLWGSKSKSVNLLLLTRSIVSLQRSTRNFTSPLAHMAALGETDNIIQSAKHFIPRSIKVWAFL